jgi:uncharacterized membrane protein HdeD (DUF308 family)
MEKRKMALLLIILGIIVLAFPLLGVLPFSILTGFGVLLLGIGLILAGYVDIKTSKALGIIEIILGVLAIILGVGFIFNPGLFTFVASLFIYLAGLLLIIVGIAALISKPGGSRWNGVVALILGLIYILLGYLIKDPFILGILIGLWLIISGVLLLFQKSY